jgi:hypothetical protein
MGRPPYPGPRPDAYEFPFEEAVEARRAADAAADALARVRRSHEDVWQQLERGGSSGRTIDVLRVRSRELLGALDGHVAALRRQADAIADDVVDARRRAEQRQLELLDWHRAYRAWAAWEPELDTVVPGPRAPSRFR